MAQLENQAPALPELEWDIESNRKAVLIKLMEALQSAIQHWKRIARGEVRGTGLGCTWEVTPNDVLGRCRRYLRPPPRRHGGAGASESWAATTKP